MCGPWNQVIQEEEVPEPLEVTLGCGLVLVEHGSITSELGKEFPEKEECEHVSG